MPAPKNNIKKVEETRRDSYDRSTNASNEEFFNKKMFEEAVEDTLAKRGIDSKEIANIKSEIESSYLKRIKDQNLDASEKNNEVIPIKEKENSTNKYSNLSLEFTEKLEKWIDTLKTIKEDRTYEHIIAKVLEIYENQRSYTKTVSEICTEVEGIEHNEEFFTALLNLSEAMATPIKNIPSIHGEEKTLEGGLEIDIAGEVYDFTIEHI